MMIRTYVRRSKSDEGKQQFSLDVQRAGCREFVERLQLGGQEAIEYADDGRAGDDFHNRAGLRRLLEDAAPGDVIVCRDQSRLGRDAIEVTLVIRDLVRDRGCRLFYYTTGHEVQFANAIDQATTFIQGTGHQMELEAIRSRTREGLRSRVRAGRIAGGACYGYTLERKRDLSGRGYTTAHVNADEAKVVQRIYEMFRDNHGLKAIARQLNREGVPSPSHGRRGSGSWAPSAIRSMLSNPRYRGVYVHGRIKKVQRGGTMVRVKADPSEVLEIEVPEWTIVDDATWFAVQEKFSKQAPRRRMVKAAAKYPLTGIARCEQCGGAIGCARTKKQGQIVRAYGCTFHRERGKEVCDASVLQPMEEVEEALIQKVEQDLLDQRVIDRTVELMTEEARAQNALPEVDVSALEAELAEVQAERKKIARAVALADDVPELVAELNRRTARIRHLEELIESAQRAPAGVERHIADIEARARQAAAEIGQNLTNREHLREVLLQLFPDGLGFSPAWVGRRRVWRIKGYPRLGDFPIAWRPQRFLRLVGPRFSFDFQLLRDTSARGR